MNHTQQEEDFVLSLREERLEQRKKKPAILMGILIGILLALGIGWFTFGRYVSLYYSGDSSQLPIIHADNSVEGMKPETPGGMNVPDRDKLVYERLRKNNADLPVERLLPVTEAPQLPVKKETVEIVKETVSASDSSAPSSDDVIGALAEQIIEEEKEEELASALVYEDDGTPIEVMFEEVQPAQKAEVKKPEAKKEVPVKKEKVAEKAPKALPLKEVKQVKKEQKVVAPVLEKDVFRVQIVSTRSEEAAENEFKRLSKKHASTIGAQPHIVSKAVSAKGTFYRLRIGSFEKKETAQKLCNQLKEQKQECFVVK